MGGSCAARRVGGDVKADEDDEWGGARRGRFT